jgi:hypothetical protein
MAAKEISVKKYVVRLSGEERSQLIGLAAFHAIPTSYNLSGFVDAGGLIHFRCRAYARRSSLSLDHAPLTPAECRPRGSPWSSARSRPA